VTEFVFTRPWIGQILDESVLDQELVAFLLISYMFLKQSKFEILESF